jgi:hypothetical protein
VVGWLGSRCGRGRSDERAIYSIWSRKRRVTSLLFYDMLPFAMRRSRLARIRLLATILKVCSYRGGGDSSALECLYAS